MNFTAAQEEAIAARGNVIVVAGAGTGKTKTLVERCLHCLLDEKAPASLEEILMVTFTDAAAAEMRQRIRARIEEHIAAHPKELCWPEQLALFDTAHIGTLHSFCLKLVRQHFYELELDPQLAVMPDDEARLLAEETLTGILQAHYRGETDRAEEVQRLIQVQGQGWDEPIRDLVMKLHHHTQTLRDPGAWMASQLAMFEQEKPAQWESWLMEAAQEWRSRWLDAFKAMDNSKAAECAAILQKLPVEPTRGLWAAALERAVFADGEWPAKKKTVLRKPLEKFFEETEFLHSLARQDGKEDPLAQDWKWVRGPMIALLQLAREFTETFAASKKELGAVDFHDLEQHALRLLLDESNGVARQWREKLRFIFVDEYQDINEAQDAILTALSRGGGAANRFLVGDVKQSIYRFRLADPRIFQGYAEKWRGEQGRSIPLTDNFRSREALIGFVNALFSGLMRKEIGGVAYDDDAKLRFGAPEEREALSTAKDASPRVELHLRLKGAEAESGEDDGQSRRATSEVINLEDAGKEARLVGLRLRELKTSGHQVWDDETKAMRPVRWSDMAVLLRSPSGRAESYAREFTRLRVPLFVARGGFYQSMEVADLLSLLQLLDNPLQDVPALAVMRSPLVGMTVDELAAVRLAIPRGHYWAAAQRFHESKNAHPAWRKADSFFKHFAAWRRLARQVSLSRCLEAVLADTHYAEWLLTQPRGEQRHANMRRLLGLARQFDQFQRQGLFRFLRFIEAQQAADTEPDVAAVAGEDSVTLMSVHQSKGLEFPVVVVADLGRTFNQSDLRAEIILDEQFGLCPRIKPPQTGRRYPSLPYELAKQRQRREAMGEEFRLLYVALTRARDTLILSGSASQRKFEAWQESDLSTATLLEAKNYLDWIGAWAGSTEGEYPEGQSGAAKLWSWTIYDEHDARLQDGAQEKSTEAGDEAMSAGIDATALRKLRERLDWKYAHGAAGHISAKTSVTAVRRQLAEDADDPAQQIFRFRARRRKSELSATEIGSAHHTFLQWLAFERAGSVMDLKAEAARMEQEKILSAAEVVGLDFEALAGFWKSEVGKKILAHEKFVRRELAFTARFTPGELNPADVAVKDEFVVVQGAADLVVILPKEIWLLDFKTDNIKQGELAERTKEYEPQLRLYARALERIYGRPVSQSWLHFLALNKSVAAGRVLGDN